MRISPTLAASIGLVILAVAAPGKAHAETYEPEPIAAQKRPPPYIIEDDPLDTSTVAPTPPPPTDYESDRDRYARWRLSGGAGVRFGSFTVNGDSTGAAIPFHLDLGARHRRLYVFASYDLFSIDANIPKLDAGDTTARASELAQLGDGSGLVHRVGASARYAVGRYAEHDGGFDLWTEAGVGLQHIRWDAGGVWTRPDVALGFGATMLYLGKQKHAGLSLGLRVMLAPRNDVMGAPAVCGGPCDKATPPSGTDRSFMFDITLPFGL